MAFMKSSIAFGLVWLNSITISIIIYLAINEFNHYDNNHYSYHPNLRGTKEKLFSSKNDFIFENSIKELTKEEQPKNLRNLSYSQDCSISIVYMGIAGIFFIVLLIVSFCLTENECCPSNDCKCCEEGDCNLSGSTNGMDLGAAIGYSFIMVVILAFLAIIYLIRACGKHISRYFAIFALIIIDLLIFIISLIIGINSGFYINTILMLTLPLISAICNFLGILLPNLNGCERLRYNYIYVDNPSQNNLQVNPVPYPPQDINAPISLNTNPIEQPLVETQTPIEKNMTPINEQNLNTNSGYDNKAENIYNAPPVEYPSQSEYNNHYNSIDENGDNNIMYPATQIIYANNPNP